MRVNPGNRQPVQPQPQGQLARNVPPGTSVSIQPQGQLASNVPPGTSVSMRPQYPTPPAYGHQGPRGTPVITPNGNHNQTQAVARTVLTNDGHVVPGTERRR